MKETKEVNLEETVRNLAWSPRGKKCCQLLREFMNSTGCGLDSGNRDAFADLLQEYWRRPGAVEEVIQEICGDMDKPKVYLTVGEYGLRAHIPHKLKVEVVLLPDDTECPEIGTYALVLDNKIKTTLL